MHGRNTREEAEDKERNLGRPIFKGTCMPQLAVGFYTIGWRPGLLVKWIIQSTVYNSSDGLAPYQFGPTSLPLPYEGLSSFNVGEHSAFRASSLGFFQDKKQVSMSEGVFQHTLPESMWLIPERKDKEELELAF